MLERSITLTNTQGSLNWDNRTRKYDGGWELFYAIHPPYRVGFWTVQKGFALHIWINTYLYFIVINRPKLFHTKFVNEHQIK